jgi:protein SCO1/2
MKRAVLALLVLLALVAGPRRARADEPIPYPLQGIGIEDRAGDPIPKDAKFVDQDGHEVTLGDYLVDGKPVVLVMAYYECPMLCSTVLSGVEKGMADLAWTAGKDYRALTVSFDPRDTPAKAAEKRATYVASYKRQVGPKGWDFLVGKQPEIERLADAVGFKYRWDDRQKQFAHAAGAFVLTPDGRVSRTIYGIDFPSRDLRLALTEASDGKLGTSVEKALLFCFHYDPNAGGYVLASKRLMMVGGVLTMLILGLFLLRHWRIESNRSRAPEEAHP